MLNFGAWRFEATDSRTPEEVEAILAHKKTVLFEVGLVVDSR